MFSLIAFLLLVSGASLLGLLLSAAHHSGATSAPGIAKTEHRQVGVSPSTAASPISTIPQLAQNYAGRIVDTGVAGTVTNLYLSNIKQKQGQISGIFSGLYQVGTFTGTVLSDGTFHFSVKISTGFLNCTGKIKVGGELEGTFQVVDPQGNPLGEYGAWTADPTPS